MECGPKGSMIEKDELQLGDLIQLSFNGIVYGHTLIVTKIEGEEIFVCAHSNDSKNRNLNTYSFKKMRCVKIY